MLWHPAISVSTLKPQQNIVAVVVDDSRSMAHPRRRQDPHRASRVRARRRPGLARWRRSSRCASTASARPRTRREDRPAHGPPRPRASADALKQIASEAASLPIGAVVLVSDGAENCGGIDRDTIAEIRRYRIPVHTVGFGRGASDRDIEIADAVLPARTLADSRIAAQVTLRQYGYEDRQGAAHGFRWRENAGLPGNHAKADGEPQTESLMFNAGAAGAKTLAITVE